MKKKERKEEILRLLKMKADELGRMPKKVEIDKDRRLPSYETYRQYVGTLPALVTAIGYKSRKDARCEEILEKIKEIGKNLGRMPTAAEIKKTCGMHSSKSVYRCFDSFRNLGKDLGLPPRKRLIYTDEELLKRLRLRAEELGKAPTMKEVEAAPSLPSISTYVSRFGSHGKALDRIGWKGKRRRRNKKQ